MGSSYRQAPGLRRDDPPMHPLIRGLVDSLPKGGETWALDDAVNWLEAAAVNLRLVYKFKGSITVKANTPSGMDMATEAWRRHSETPS